jgi:outer membrane protein assembly factor BamA
MRCDHRLWLIAALAFAQPLLAQPADSVRYGLLPGFAYDSDNGLNIAIDAHRFNYGQKQVPFKSLSRYRMSYRSIGALTLSFSHEQVRTFDTDLRSSFDGLIARNYGAIHLGRTLRGDFDRERFDTTTYYSFNSDLINIGFSTRLPLGAIVGMRRTDVKVGLRLVHESPFDLEADGFMATERPTGWDGSTYVLAETGGVWEQRDSEFLPGNGTYAAWTVKSSVPGLSHTLMGQISGDVRLYRRLTPLGAPIHLVFAQRISADHVVGDEPYWFVPNLGGTNGLRGYLWKRFSGDGIVHSQTELRSWLPVLPWYDIRLGLNGFVDAGSAYDKGFTLWEPTATAGFGVLVSILNPDFFIKYEMGFSKEGAGVYLGSGYAF